MLQCIANFRAASSMQALGSPGGRHAADSWRAGRPAGKTISPFSNLRIADAYGRTASVLSYADKCRRWERLEGGTLGVLLAKQLQLRQKGAPAGIVQVSALKLKNRGSSKVLYICPSSTFQKSFADCGAGAGSCGRTMLQLSTLSVTYQ